MTEERVDNATENANPNSDFASNGRYIPYSGGTMGWFDNSGVLICQQGNNYLFHTIWDSEEIRQKQFHRMGSSFNRRTSAKRQGTKIPVRITWGRGKNKKSWEGFSKDVSMEGMRLQFREELGVQKGDVFKLEVLRREGGDAEFELESTLVWGELVGRSRPVYNMGIQFRNVKKDKKEKLRDLLLA